MSARSRLYQPEREFEGAILDLAWTYRWLAYHTFDSRKSSEGFPDLVMVRAPRLIIAELKTETGRLSAKQEWIDAFVGVASGPGVEQVVSVYVWRPSHWPEIETALR